MTGKAILEDGPPSTDPAAYAQTVWTVHLPAALEDRVVGLGVLAAALRADEEEAIRTFGHYEAGRPASFLASGRGRVTRLDTTSRVGVVHVDLEPADGAADLHIQVGPVIRGTALRDALPFITFNTFDNQVAYAAVSRELHRIVADSVLRGFDLSHLEDATVSFRGAFTLGSNGPILLTPVTLEREE